MCLLNSSSLSICYICHLLSVEWANIVCDYDLCIILNCKYYMIKTNLWIFCKNKFLVRKTFQKDRSVHSNSLQCIHITFYCFKVDSIVLPRDINSNSFQHNKLSKYKWFLFLLKSCKNWDWLWIMKVLNLLMTNE